VKCKLEFVPWRHIADWHCIQCGDCCRFYSVVLNFHEWLMIVKNYGADHTASGFNKLFIRKKDDGSCPFLHNGSYASFCTLQNTKPRACQIWPFKVLSNPQYGLANDAAFPVGEGRLFVYADPMCHGLRYGSPTYQFANFTVKEFVEIAAGVRSSQLKTTSDLGYSRFRRF
jgi:Fe-S-cluster containining protein